MTEPLPVATGRQTARYVGRQLRTMPGDVASTLLWTFAAAIATVAAPLLLGRFVDGVRAGRGLAAPTLALFAAVMLAAAIGTALAQRATEQLGAHVAAALRRSVLTRALGLPAPVLERAGIGDVSSRVTEDVEHFTTAVPVLAEVLLAVVTVAVAAPGFLSLDWRLAAAFAVVFPVYAVSLRLYLPKAAALYRAERRIAAERGRLLLESLRGRPTVAAYDMAVLQSGRNAGASAAALDAGLRVTRRFVWFSKAMNAAEALGLSAILLTGYWGVRGSAVSVGAVTAAALLFHRLFGPLGTLLLSFDDLQRAGAALARTAGVMLVPGPAAGNRRRPAGGVHLKARGIRHAYGKETVLDGLDLTVPAGTSLALVGASGAGKSTVANLVAGILTPGAGRITLADRDGPVDVADLDPSVLRDWVAVVSQESAVLSGRVRDDLNLAAPDAGDDRLHHALATAGLTLPDGLGTPTGSMTSAQTQQLALARILLRDPPVVILDEATAEAGSGGARDLERAAAAVIRGRTAIVVAHRLSQARGCGRIAVLDHGRIVESGTHEELIAAGGRYAGLWAAWRAGQVTGPGNG